MVYKTSVFSIAFLSAFLLFSRVVDAQLLYVHAHPDDESIFGGGVLPYYSQVLDKQVAVIGMVTRSNDGTNPLPLGGPISRIDTLHRAYDVYAGQALGSGSFNGLGHYETGNITGIEAGLIDTGCCSESPEASWYESTSLGVGPSSWGTSTSTIVETPGFGNIDGFSDGREAAAWSIAREIRRFRPEVVASAHDLEGDYGHSNHSATAIAAIDAFALAADTSVDIEGLAPYQAQKLYLRGDLQDNNNTISWDSGSFTSDGGINQLFHDFFEDPTIAGQSPRTVSQTGLDEHLLGEPVSSVFTFDGSREGHHSEWWTLYRSTVGMDTLEPPFSIAGDLTGSVYTDFAFGDFFQNTATDVVTVPEPSTMMLLLPGALLLVIKRKEALMAKFT